MTSQIDIYRSAGVLIREHAYRAAWEAAMRADAMTDMGDMDGAATWRRILAAIEELLRTAPVKE